MVTTVSLAAKPRYGQVDTVGKFINRSTIFPKPFEDKRKLAPTPISKPIPLHRKIRSWTELSQP